MHLYYTWKLYDSKNLHNMYVGEHKPVWSYEEYLKIMQKLSDNDAA